MASQRCKLFMGHSVVTNSCLYIPLQLANAKRAQFRRKIIMHIFQFTLHVFTDAFVQFVDDLVRKEYKACRV